MTYYLAPSLVRLRAQVNELWPERDKTSDGWIGDTSHSARKSDHNPAYDSGGVVRAIDVDEDGIDTAAVLLAVIYDPRVSYVIYEGRIWGGSLWKTYAGSNPHDKHIHISLKHTKAAEAADDWAIGTFITPQTSIRPEALTPAPRKEWSDMATEAQIEAAAQRGAAAALEALRVPAPRGSVKAVQVLGNADGFMGDTNETLASILRGDTRIPVTRSGAPTTRTARDILGGIDSSQGRVLGELAGLREVVSQLANFQGVEIDYARVEAAARAGAEAALADGIDVNVTIGKEG